MRLMVKVMFIIDCEILLMGMLSICQVSKCGGFIQMINEFYSEN